MGEDLLEIVWHLRVHDVKEILAWWSLVLRILGGEVLHEVGVLLHLRPERLDGDLVVLGDVDVVHLLLFEELLIFCEHLLEEVLGHALLFGQVKLYWKGVRREIIELLTVLVEVIVEVILALELAFNLVGHHEAEGALLGLGGRCGLHFEVYEKFK